MIFRQNEQNRQNLILKILSILSKKSAPLHSFYRC
jgi:hypothetical protein